VREQLTDAVRSLASYLVGEKELEGIDLPPLLSTTHTIAQLPEEQRQPLLDSLRDNPPYFFEHPDLDPDSDLVGLYLDDLAALEARVPPHDPNRDEALFAVAAYLRKDAKVLDALLTKHRQAYFTDRLHPESQTRRAPPDVTRAVLDLLTGDTARFFLYHPVQLEWPEGKPPLAIKQDDLWLLGTADRLLLFIAGVQPQVLWRGDPQVQATAIQKNLWTACQLSGGEWLVPDVPRPMSIRLPLPLMSTYNNYLKPLVGMLRRSPETQAT
jgi:hypothetical protein